MENRISFGISHAHRLLLIIALLSQFIGTASLARATEVTIKVPDSLETSILSAALHFTDAPLVGTPAELVLEIESQQEATIRVEVGLPQGMVRIVGELKNTATIQPNETWQMSIIVKANEPGDYQIVADITGVTSDGLSIAAHTSLYLSTSRETAMAGELPIQGVTPLEIVEPAQSLARQAGPVTDIQPGENELAQENTASEIMRAYGGSMPPSMQEVHPAQIAISTTISATQPLPYGASASVSDGEALPPTNETDDGVQEDAPRSPDDGNPVDIYSEGETDISTPEEIQGIKNSLATLDLPDSPIPPEQVEAKKIQSREEAGAHATLQSEMSTNGDDTPTPPHETPVDNSGLWLSDPSGDHQVEIGKSTLIVPSLSSDPPTVINPSELTHSLFLPVITFASPTHSQESMTIDSEGNDNNSSTVEDIDGPIETISNPSAAPPQEEPFFSSAQSSSQYTNSLFLPLITSKGEHRLDRAASAADLVVEDIWSTTTPLTSGEWENVTFRIKNRGSVGVSNRFYTRMWINGYEMNTWYTDGLNSGYSATGSVNVRANSPGNYTVKVKVDHTGVIAESNESNNVRTETWNWAGVGMPDLVVEDIWSTTTPLTSGEWENVTFRIKNQGSAGASGRFYTRMWINGYEMDTWYTDGLNNGYAATGSVNVKANSPGSYTVKVEVDYTGVVAESNESNNVRSESWNWVGAGTPDLVVEDIWSTTSPLTSGEWENVTFRIKNQGTASASGRFYTRMWIDGYEMDTWYTDGLNSGYSATGSVDVRANSPGDYTVKVQVDHTGVVAESNESNNVRNESWNWADAGKPDLTVEDIWSTTSPLTSGEWENVTFRIKNQGSASASGRFYTRMWINGYEMNTWYTDGLNSDYSATGSVNVRANSPGDYTVKVQVDHTGVVAESNESNNVRNETWNWADSGKPDLIVEDIWSTTSPLTSGEWENVTFRIKNQGSASASDRFYTRMWINGYEMNTWYTDGLNSDYSATGSVNVRANSPGNYTVKVQIDHTGIISESNEDNNIRSETWTWEEGGQADIIVEDIWSDTEPLRAGEWENVTFRIKNQGSASASTKFYTKLRIGDTDVQTWYTNLLSVGYTAQGRINVQVSPGTTTVQVVSDTTNAVLEEDEQNNTRTETWTWATSGDADLIVDDIWSSTLPLQGDDAETIHFRIKNVGSKPSRTTDMLSKAERDNNSDNLKISWDVMLNTPALVQGNISFPNVRGGDPMESTLAYFRTYGDLYRMQDPVQELRLEESNVDDLGMRHLRYGQMYRGLPVFGAQLRVHMQENGNIASVNGVYVADLDLSTTPQIDGEEALDRIKKELAIDALAVTDAPLLGIYPYGDKAYLAWEVHPYQPDDIGRWVYWIDAQTGEVITMYEDVWDARNRTIYSAENTTELRQRLLIEEGASSHEDAVAWHTYTNLGATYDYFQNTYGRDSYDDNGGEIIATVHYNQVNAFWSPYTHEFAFGSGDGVTLSDFGDALDVVAHEFTHGVTTFTANLRYRGESGALNESFSDILGAMVDRDDWLMGEDIYTPGIGGDALRDMADPPSGGSRQPDHIDHPLFQDYPWWAICDSSNDNCGVHTNSGVPNKAAYLLAEGGTHHDIAVNGIGREKTERIFYRALTQYLGNDSDFADARRLTLQACMDIYGEGSGECRSAEDAFAAVGIGEDARFHTRMYIDGRVIHTWYTQELAPGAAAEGSVQVTLPAGEKEVKVHVDYSNVVAESDESNNILAKNWTWQGSAQGDLDLTVQQLEVTQSVQKDDNSIILVRERPTMVRLHVAVSGAPGGQSSVAGVTAELHGMRNGAELAGSPIQPSGGAINLPTQPSRDNLAHSLNFLLPAEWRNDDIRLYVVLNPARSVEEKNFDNNRYPATGTLDLNFAAAVSPRVRYVPIAWNCDENNVLRPPTGTAGLSRLLQAAYPVSGARDWALDTEFAFCATAGDLRTSEAWGELLSQLSSRGDDDTYFYALVSNDVPHCAGGKCTLGMGYRSGNIAAGIYTGDTRAAAETFVHELGHNMGRGHAPSGEVCSPAPSNVDPDWPGDEAHRDSRIGVYGLDVAERTVYEPATYDFMGYCSAPTWISDYTYENLYTQMQTDSAVTDERGLEPEPALILTGRIQDNGRAGRIDPVFQYPARLTPVASGAYSVALLDSNNVELARYPFTPATLLTYTDNAASNESEMLSFRLTVPAVESLATIRLYRGETLLSERSAGTQLPIIHDFDTSRSVSQEDGWTISMAGDASDADGDRLTYSARFSPDGGQTWQMIAANMPHLSTTLALSGFKGTEEGILEIMASDGIHTERIQMGSIHLGEQAPVISLLAPTNNQEHRFGTPLILMGDARDPEDGPLAGENLVWSTEEVGELGRGHTTQVLNALHPGEHTITLTATDSQGNQSQKHVTIQILAPTNE